MDEYGARQHGRLVVDASHIVDVSRGKRTKLPWNAPRARIDKTIFLACYPLLLLGLAVVNEM